MSKDQAAGPADARAARRAGRWPAASAADAEGPARLSGPLPTAVGARGRPAGPRYVEARPWRRVRPALVTCRTRAGMFLVELPVRDPDGGAARVETVRPDSRAVGGWVSLPWQSTSMGIRMPAGTDLGDLVAISVESGFAVAAEDWDDVDTSSSYAAPEDSPVSDIAADDEVLVVRRTWFGYLDTLDPAVLVFSGPYPDLVAAHGAAQHAVIRHRHSAAQPEHGPGHRLMGEGALPPSVVEVTFDGPSATVGDPVYGWLTVPTARLSAALAMPVDDLRSLLRPLVGPPPEGTAHATLAALAAARAPERLPDIHRPPGAEPPRTGWVPDTTFADPPTPLATEPAWPRPTSATPAAESAAPLRLDLGGYGL